MFFPVPYIPEQSYRGGRGYGADRSKVAALLNIPGGVLKHGAVDLIVPHGTPVLAIDDGVVMKGPYAFFLGTYALEVQHPRFIARYCEIKAVAEVKVGQTVKGGQVIAYVGNQPGADMLHLELFDGSLSGPLTTDRSAANAPYFRRKDIMDPTAILDSVRNTSALRNKKAKYEFEISGDRKFLPTLTLNDI